DARRPGLVLTAVRSGGREDVDDEDQRRVQRDLLPAALVAVAEVGRDDQQHLAADRLARETLRPARDHAAEGERGGLAAVPRGVELRAVPEPARVVHGQRL